MKNLKIIIGLIMLTILTGCSGDHTFVVWTVSDIIGLSVWTLIILIGIILFLFFWLRDIFIKFIDKIKK